MRISDWSSDVCSSDLTLENAGGRWGVAEKSGYPADFEKVRATLLSVSQMETVEPRTAKPELLPKLEPSDVDAPESKRSEEHTSELQSLMRISYAVFCLKKKTKKHIRP